MQVLIIDDDPYIREMISTMLRGEDYRVFEAADGDQGLKKLKSERGIDIVITDIIMPEKEGIETIQEITRYSPKVKILAISGGGKVSAENYLNLAKGLGADLILKKPFVKQDLLESLSMLTV